MPIVESENRAVALAAFSENLGDRFLHRSSAPFVTNLMEALWRPRERRDEMPGDSSRISWRPRERCTFMEAPL